MVIIIGILAMIGLPQFFKVAERARSSEGVSLLGAVRSAELRYAAGCGVTTNILAKLDVDMPDTIRYFNAPVPNSIGFDPNDPGNFDALVATITRNAANNPGYGAYVLQIRLNGAINCTDAGTSICSTLGYPAP